MNHTHTFQFPTTYLAPRGTPLYWRDEMSGVLPAAIWAYIAHVAEPLTAPAPAPEQLGLVIAYLRYVIAAPCWKGDRELAALRAGAGKLATLRDVRAWIGRAVKLGIDPL